MLPFGEAPARGDRPFVRREDRVYHPAVIGGYALISPDDDRGARFIHKGPLGPPAQAQGKVDGAIWSDAVLPQGGAFAENLSSKCQP